MYKELNKLNRKPTQDRVWSIRDLTGTLTHKTKQEHQRFKRLSGFLALITANYATLNENQTNMATSEMQPNNLRLIENGNG